MPSLERIGEEDDIYVDITAPDPIHIKHLKKAETASLLQRSKSFELTVCQKIGIAFACGGGTSVALYYLVQFIIACTKNPYL